MGNMAMDHQRLCSVQVRCDFQLSGPSSGLETSPHSPAEYHSAMSSQDRLNPVKLRQNLFFPLLLPAISHSDEKSD